MKNKYQFDYPVNEIFKDIESLNGRAFLVGGIVRDMLLYGKVDYHDVDVEIYGLTIEQLENILKKYGEVNISIFIISTPHFLFKPFYIEIPAIHQVISYLHTTDYLCVL